MYKVNVTFFLKQRILFIGKIGAQGVSKCSSYSIDQIP